MINQDTHKVVFRRDSGGESPFTAIEAGFFLWAARFDLTYGSTRKLYSPGAANPAEFDGTPKPFVALLFPVYCTPYGDLHLSLNESNDSVQCGYTYLTHTQLEYDFKGCQSLARQSVSDYLEYIYNPFEDGDVWGYEITCRKSDKVVDSCWGFYGRTLEDTGLLLHFEDEHTFDLNYLKGAWDNREQK